MRGITNQISDVDETKEVCFCDKDLKENDSV